MEEGRYWIYWNLIEDLYVVTANGEQHWSLDSGPSSAGHSLHQPMD